MKYSPEQLAEPGTEHAHQVALFCWMGDQVREDIYPELRWAYAIPNGGERNLAVAGRLRAEGVKSGVSDVCIPVGRHGYSGFYIEMKKPGALKQESAKQKEFGAFVTTQGFLYRCCDSWEMARDCIIWYMS
jgi:hypothetical protein